MREQGHAFRERICVKEHWHAHRECGREREQCHAYREGVCEREQWQGSSERLRERVMAVIDTYSLQQRQCVFDL